MAPKLLWSRSIVSTGGLFSKSSCRHTSTHRDENFVSCGLLPVYKPRYWTSADVVQEVKSILNTDIKSKKRKIKVGHGEPICLSYAGAHENVHTF